MEGMYFVFPCNHVVESELARQFRPDIGSLVLVRHMNCMLCEGDELPGKMILAADDAFSLLSELASL